MNSISSFHSRGALSTRHGNQETSVSREHEVGQSHHRGHASRVEFHQDETLPSSRSETVHKGPFTRENSASHSDLSTISDTQLQSPRLSQSYEEEDQEVSRNNSQASLTFHRDGTSRAQSHSSLSQDSSTCLLTENTSYMRSITSLVGGGEGPIRSLSDILVWTETAMGTATGLLDSSRTSVTDILHGTGTALRSVTSLLGGAHSAFASGILSGTGTALRTVTHLIGSIERRTVEGIRSAFRYVANHISPNRNNPNMSPNPD